MTPPVQPPTEVPETDAARYREPRWSWQSQGSDLRVGYMAVDGRVSLADLIDHMHTLAPDSPLNAIEVNFATVKWTRPATADELVERSAWQARQRERQEKWERETLDRLTKKYEESR